MPIDDASPGKVRLRSSVGPPTEISVYDRGDAASGHLWLPRCGVFFRAFETMNARPGATSSIVAQSLRRLRFPCTTVVMPSQVTYGYHDVPFFPCVREE
ncbi:MAG: hypothetical protein WKF77_00385 [Planctomycetaceae bacterium]